RSSVEWSISESTPRLPVARVRKILRHTNTSAEPTEASAATCFAELEDVPEIKALRACKRLFTPRRDYRTQSGGGATMGMRRASLWGPCTSTSSSSSEGETTVLGTPLSAVP